MHRFKKCLVCYNTSYISHGKRLFPCSALTVRKRCSHPNNEFPRCLICLNSWKKAKRIAVFHVFLDRTYNKTLEEIMLSFTSYNFLLLLHIVLAYSHDGWPIKLNELVLFWHLPAVLWWLLITALSLFKICNLFRAALVVRADKNCTTYCIEIPKLCAPTIVQCFCATLARTTRQTGLEARRDETSYFRLYERLAGLVNIPSYLGRNR